MSFTALISEFPCLYDTTCAFFRDRTVKQRALQALRDKMNSDNNERVTLADVKRRVRNYQAHIRRSRKRLVSV